MNKVERRLENNWAQYDEVISNFRYVMSRREALDILDEIGDDFAALDFETTGLSPYSAKVRLSCIYHPDTGIVLLDHFFCGSFEHHVRNMLRPFWVVYNAKFETRWFDRYIPNEVCLIDVDFLAKVHRGGGHSSLAVMARRDLSLIMEKGEQLSDWSQERLSQSQLEYAARDALVTWLLYEHWIKKLGNNQKKRDAAMMLQDAVRPTVECEETGMVLDVDHHEKNIAMWNMKQQVAYKRVRHWTNERVLPNLGSDKQVAEILEQQLDKASLAAWPRTEKTGRLQLSRKVIQPLVAKSPYPFSRWMNALLRFRYYRKYLSTYGDTLITKQHLSDGIGYRLNIAAAATGRYSSSDINIQNIPRNLGVRKALLPPEAFDFLCVADYAGIEVRVLAELSNDETLRQDAIYGDVHAGSASAIFAIDEDEFNAVLNDVSHPMQGKFKEMRIRGKGFTFQNVYGAQALALSIVLKCSVEEADAALRAWAKRYPRAYNYRHVIFDEMVNGGYLPVCDGRTIFVNKADRTLPVASNYGVQGAAASVMYRAMYHCWRLRNEESDSSLIRLVATVHDELLLAAVDGEEEHAKDILERGMTQGWLDIFPDTDTNNLVEVAHGISWGDAK